MSLIRNALGILLIVAIWPLGIDRQIESRVTTQKITIDKAKIELRDGRAYWVRLPAMFESSSIGFMREGAVDHRLRRSPNVLNVSRFGGGAFILRGRNLYFSSTDGSDPRTNDLTYQWRVPVVVPPWARWATVGCGILMMLPLLQSLVVWLARGARRAACWLAGGAGRLAASLRKSIRLAWSGPEWPVAYAMCRIAFGAMFYMRAFGIDGESIVASLAAKSPELYDPVGLLKLFGSHPLPASLFFWLVPLFRIVSVTLILGFCSRMSMLIGFLCYYWLDATPSSYQLAWSHGYVPVLLPGLVMLLGPRQTRLAIDALRGPSDVAGSRVTVIGLQAMLGALFLNAGIYKLWLGNHEFARWCFSDTLRNHIIFQRWVVQEPIQEGLAWWLREPWRWRLLAVGNIVAQITPFFAIFFSRRPWLRACCGALLVAEVLSLGAVMRLWNPHWLWMSIFFVDWDALWNRFRLRFNPVVALSDRAAPIIAPMRFPRRGLILSILFFQLFISHGFYTQLRWSYPFTSAPMYSSIMAEPPYDGHKPWLESWSAFHIECVPDLPDEKHSFLWRNKYGIVYLPPERRRIEVAEMIHQIKEWGHRLDRLIVYRCDWEVERPPSLSMRQVRRSKLCEWTLDHGLVWIEWDLVQSSSGERCLTVKRFEDGKPVPRTFALKYSERGSSELHPIESKQERETLLYTQPVAKRGTPLWIHLQDTNEPPDAEPWSGPCAY